MGLTIHFSFRAPPEADGEAAVEHIKRLQAFCEDRPFAEVSACQHFRGERECDFESTDKDDPAWWLKIQAREYIPRKEILWHPDPQDIQWGNHAGKKLEVHHEVKAVEIVGFSAWPGEGCESLEIGLARYPETTEWFDLRYSRRPRYRTIRTNLRGWHWGGFCKTQYASTYGLTHFLRCHLLVITVLDRAKELGILRQVNDEGHYWKRRRLDVLTHELEGYNALVGVFAKLLNESAPEGLTPESEIENHPDYQDFTLEKLARDFPEMHAAVAKTAKLLRRAKLTSNTR
jgi:hypothetical protein